MICSKCQRVSQIIHDLLQSAIGGRTPFLEFHPHVSNHTALEASGANGCDFCKLLVQCVVDQLGVDKISRLSCEQESLSFKVDGYHAAGQFCIEAITFYFGYSDAPFLFRNFDLSFRVELLQSSGRLTTQTFLLSFIYYWDDFQCLEI